MRCGSISLCVSLPDVAHLSSVAADGRARGNITLNPAFLSFFASADPNLKSALVRMCPSRPGVWKYNCPVSRSVCSYIVDLTGIQQMIGSDGRSKTRDFLHKVNLR